MICTISNLKGDVIYDKDVEELFNVQLTILNALKKIPESERRYKSNFIVNYNGHNFKATKRFDKQFTLKEIR